MLVYITAIVICFFFESINEKIVGKGSFFFKYLSMFVLFIISAIRFNVGIDFSGTYTNVYYLLLSGSKNIRMDIGFLLLYKLIVFFNLDLQWIFVISSFIINLFVFKAINSLSKDTKLSTYIYICSTFYFFGMNGIRQAISMALFYYSLKFLSEKKCIKYYIVNIIGCLFHQSALLFLPIYFIVNHRFKKKTNYIIIAIIPFFITSLLAPIIINVLKNTRYALYFMYNNYGVMKFLNLSSIINLIICIIFLKIIDLKDDSKEGNLSFAYFIIHYIGVCLTAFMTSIPLALRVFESFRFIDFLSVPYLLKKYNGKFTSLIYIFVIFLYFAYFMYHIFLKNANGVLPYTTIFG